MRALQLKNFRSDPELVDLPEPEPGPGQAVLPGLDDLRDPGPADDPELAAGFLFTEGILNGPHQIRDAGQCIADA